MKIESVLISTDARTGDPSSFGSIDEVREMYSELGWESDPADDGIMTIADAIAEQCRCGCSGDAEEWVRHLRGLSGDTLDVFSDQDLYDYVASVLRDFQPDGHIHDRVCELAREADADWLFEYLFDVEGRSGCNGIWAVMLTSDGPEHARARIDILNLGGLPVGISAHNETTKNKLNERLYRDCGYVSDWDEG